MTDEKQIRIIFHEVLVGILSSYNYDYDDESILSEEPLYLDELDRIDLIAELEARLDIDIPDEIEEELETVGDYIELIKELVNEL